MNLKKPDTFILIILLVPFFKPVGPAYYSWFNTIIQVWKIVAIGIMLLGTMQSNISRLNVKISGFWGLYIFWFLHIINCVRYGNGVGDTLNNAVTSIVLINVIRFSVKHSWHMKLLRALNYIFTCYIVLQVLSIFVVRLGYVLFEEMEGDFNYFLGTDNYSAFAIYPMLAIVLLYQALSGRFEKIKKSGWLLMVAVVISYLYVKSLTAAGVGIVLILFLALKDHWKNITKYINVKNALLVVLIAWILIHYFNIQNIFFNLLENVLDKGVTLNSRTYIWSKAVDLIKEKPILGYGTLQLDNSWALYGTTHAHNIFLELLLRTGIIGTLGYLWFMTGFIRHNRKIMNTSPINTLVIFLVAQILLFAMDFYVTFQYFYCFMGILYFAYSFTKKVE